MNKNIKVPQIIIDLLKSKNKEDFYLAETLCLNYLNFKDLEETGRDYPHIVYSNVLRYIKITDIFDDIRTWIHHSRETFQYTKIQLKQRFPNENII